MHSEKRDENLSTCRICGGNHYQVIDFDGQHVCLRCATVAVRHYFGCA